MAAGHASVCALLAHAKTAISVISRVFVKGQFGIVSWCNHSTPFFANLCLAVEDFWVFCIGSCEPVHEDSTEKGLARSRLHYN